mmetsp:Transcript_79372/g.250756  ORF Transcript_79372/g.250756 Transcript_79372/m.250756 type:complete len:598 (-) Transcript_79372:103-1896(-)
MVRQAAPSGGQDTFNESFAPSFRRNSLADSPGTLGPLGLPRRGGSLLDGSRSGPSLEAFPGPVGFHKPGLDDPFLPGPSRLGILKKDRSAPGFEHAGRCLNAPIAPPSSGPLAGLLQQWDGTSPKNTLQLASSLGSSPAGSPLARTVRSPKQAQPPPAEIQALHPVKPVTPPKVESALVSKGKATKRRPLRGPLDAEASSPLLSRSSSSSGGSFFSGGIGDRVEEVLNIKPSKPPAGASITECKRRSNIVIKKNDPAVALMMCDAAILEDPTLPHNWRERSTARMRLGNLGGVLSDIAVIKRLGAMRESDWILSAEAKLKLGDYPGVVEDAAEALKITEYRSKSWLMSGRAKLMLRDFEGANKDLSEGLRLDPEEAQDWAHRAHARLRLGDNTGAYYDCNEAVRLDPGDPMGWFFRAEARINRKDFNGAIADCDRCLRLNSRFAAALSHRSTARLHLEDYDGVIQDCTEAIKQNPKIATAWGNRGEAKHMKGDLNGALADCEEAKRLNAEYARALYWCGKTKLDKGQYSMAIDDSKSAIFLEPDYQDPRDVLRVSQSSKRIVATWRVPYIEKLREGHVPRKKGMALVNAGSDFASDA